MADMLFNKSLASGCFPKKYKHAIVIPLLKKDNLNASQPKNVRPVSNLPYLLKLLETVVKTRLQEFLDEHDLMTSYHPISPPTGNSTVLRQHCCTSTTTYSSPASKVKCLVSACWT